jgi:protein tyrosine/serine phosphatase
VLHVPEDPAKHFHRVSQGIYRGARPDEPGVGRLAELGFKTIVNLEDDDDAVAVERRWATALALEQVASPMSGMSTPNDDQVNDLLMLLADQAKRPVLVHCKKGMDRTGLVIALHRVFNERWTAPIAMAEWNALGRNKLLLELDDYFHDKTGWHD